jgi:Ca2+-transporting ATPase
MNSHEPVWTLSASALLDSLGTSLGGLSENEASRRLKQFGLNELPEPERRPLPLLLFDQLTHFMALLLWLAGGLAFISRLPELGLAIWAVILINAGFSFWQEYKAERALTELRKILPADARVVRGGKLRIVPARELVPGDMVQLEEGDRISADARLISSAAMIVDLSLLTGESKPVRRDAEAMPPPAAAYNEVPNVVLGGTNVTAGRGRAIVFATGMDSEVGKVAHLTASVERERSTLEAQIERVVRIITVLALGMGAAVFALVYLLIGMTLRESLIFAIGIIVANVPEGLLPTVTLALAMGVQRMAKRQALVRRLSAVETLSATTVICTDKTGTLTKNEMTVRSMWVPRSFVDVTGNGYDTEGAIIAADTDLSRRARLLVLSAALCSNATVSREVATNRVRIIGDATEGALLVAAGKAGFEPENIERSATRVRELPFESHRKMMTVVVRWNEDDLWPGARILSITKGAPLEVLARCGFVQDGRATTFIADDDRARITSAHDELARRGFRVLAVAARALDAEPDNAQADTFEHDMTFIGLIGLMDPPRPEVAKAVEACRRAGIAVTMTTGDYGLTASVIARQIGMTGDDTQVITGQDLQRMSRAELRTLLRGRTGLIFARVLPEQKLQIVEAYKSLGEVVAVTGDGVNDAPALRSAHIGIAMGATGTDVAKQAADIVLIDDNFATIVSAIEEGRTVYQNIRKFMAYILASNVPEIVPFIAMVSAKIPPALNILQILAVDLGTDMVPALALGAEPPEAGTMDTPPRVKDRPLLDARLLARSYVFLGTLEAAVSMLAFLMVWRIHGYSFSDLQGATLAILNHTARNDLMAVYFQATAAALTAIVMAQIGNVFACRSERVSAFRQDFKRNPLIFWGIATEVALLWTVLYVPFLQRIFQTAPFPRLMWVFLVLAPILLVSADALQKALRRFSLLRSLRHT